MNNKITKTEFTREEIETIKTLLYKMYECDLFIGKYDAKHGNKSFMYGIACVMEYLHYLIDENLGDTFSNTFIHNMIASEEKARN